MAMLLYSPRGIPAGYRFMQGFGVNTYKWVNAEGDTVLVKYHWIPKQGVKSWTAADAAAVQADDLGPHSKDLFEAIERGDHPSGSCACRSSATTSTPSSTSTRSTTPRCGPRTIRAAAGGRMVLNRNVENVFAENEQIAFGTGVLVDGLDFSDDKMLVGRTFSYSDTQRYRVGPNYLQLPVNSPKVPVATNQRDSQMAYSVDDPGENPHVNYEPSITGGLSEAPEPDHDEVGPEINGRLTRKRIPRTNDYKQAGRALPAPGGLGARGPDLQPDRRARPVRPEHPGADDLAPVHDRDGAGAARGRRDRHLGRRRAQPAAAGDPDAHRRGAAAAGQPRQQPAAGRERADR